MKTGVPGPALAVGLMAAAFLSAALLPKFELDIDSHCEAGGAVSQLKARFQGARFWRDQLWYLDREIARVQAQPDRLRAMNRAVAEARRRIDDSQEAVYQRNPEARPSPEFAEAEVLRREADAVEMAGVERMLEASALEHLQRLASCRPLVASRASGRD